MRGPGEPSLRAAIIAGSMGLGLLTPALPVLAQETEQTTRQEAPIRLNAVEVTASKRPQRLDEVDGSVSVRTGEDLREAGVTTVEDLEKIIPGLIIRTRGNRAYSNVSLRGVTSPDFYNPAIQVYVDGVPQDVAYLTQELVDVERVEVLRGPQGTLYGRNAHGGVINVITRKPDNEIGGRVGATISTHDRDMDAGLSAPIAEDFLYGAVDVRRSEYLGQIDDVATGEDDIDGSRTLFGRAKLRLAPKDSPLDISLTAQRDGLESHEEHYLSEANLHDLEFNSATQAGQNEFKRNVNSFALSASYDFGPATVTSVTSYQDRDLPKRLIQGFDSPEFQDTFAQELRLGFELDEGISGVFGLYGQDTAFVRKTQAFGGSIGPATNKIDIRSYAVFGEVTYGLTDNVDLTGGLRWSYEDAAIDFQRFAPLALSINDDDSFQDFSPKLALGWQVAEDHRVYILASRGFKPGGFNRALPFTVADPTVVVAYDPETSTNVELGWRGSFLDGRVEAGSAAYWISTKDKQIYVGPIRAQFLRNAGDAVSYGVELDSRVYATDDLTFDLGVTLGRSKFTDAEDPQTGADFDGNRLPYAPDYSVVAAAQYFLPQDVVPGDIGLRVAGTYYSRTYFDEANTLTQPGYLLLDASFDLVLDNGLSLSLFGQNLTDKIYRTYSYRQAGTVFSSIGRGRVVGVRGQFKF